MNSLLDLLPIELISLIYRYKQEMEDWDIYVLFWNMIYANLVLQ